MLIHVVTSNEKNELVSLVNIQPMKKMNWCLWLIYRGADKFLARPGRKQATATADFDIHIFYLLS